jgi:hypothetical protein
MRLIDLRLIPDVERIPLGVEVEKSISLDRHTRVTQRAPSVRDDRNHVGEDEVPWAWQTHRTLKQPPAPPSLYLDRRLILDELENGDVVITRPDGVRVHVFRHAIESTVSASALQTESAQPTSKAG